MVFPQIAQSGSAVAAGETTTATGNASMVTDKSSSFGNRSSQKSAWHMQLIDQRFKRYFRCVTAWM
jgi:hypothetical protein